MAVKQKTDVMDLLTKKSPLLNIFYSAMVAFPVIGIVIESQQCDDWFARSGSALVLLALCMIATSKLEALSYLDRITDQIRTEMPEGEFRKTLQKLRSYAQCEVSRWRIAELVAASSGTFIWGFGDLLLNFDSCII